MNYGWAVLTNSKFLSVSVISILLAVSVFVGYSLHSPPLSGSPKTIVLRAESTEFFFGNPKAGFNCELDTSNAPGSQYPTMTYCQSVNPPQSAHLGNDGRAKLCIGISCIGDPGLGTPTYPVGTSVMLGRAACLLVAQLVRCQRGHHGFVLAANQSLNRRW